MTTAPFCNLRLEAVREATARAAVIVFEETKHRQKEENIHPKLSIALHDLARALTELSRCDNHYYLHGQLRSLGSTLRIIGQRILNMVAKTV